MAETGTQPAVLEQISGELLVAIDQLSNTSQILLSKFHDREGVTVTKVPWPECRFCGTGSSHGELHTHKTECRFAQLKLEHHRYYEAAKSFGGVQKIVEASIAYCDKVCSFLADAKIVAVIETDEDGNSNLERLAELYAARDNYLTLWH